ncbi:MAG: hypothetical protein R3181_03510 [Rubricoccaceae bacterium]|nr:hypothetical protein [Rubricoccaceae bacterium]
MRRLSVVADLDLVVDGHPVAIRGDGDRLRFEVDEPRTAWRLFRSNRPGRALVRSITDTLDVFGVDVDVVVRGRSVASLGPSAHGGRLLGALGLPGVQLSGGPSGRRLRWALVGAAFLGGVLLGARR